MNSPTRFSLTMLLSLAIASPSLADEKQDLSMLTVERIFAKRDFESQSFSPQWLADGSGYTTLDKSKGPVGGRDIVRSDPHSGKRQIMVPAAHLIPPHQTVPLKIDRYSFSKDCSLLLVYTNSKRVWRRNTRGDYWVLDRSSRELWKLGGEAQPSTLMFAKFSPSSKQVAYVRKNNIYLEDLQDRRITALTSGSSHIISGTFDWVYEEELGLRDGFRWSPNGKSIAYWQLDTSGVRSFPLINNTGSLYPKIKWIPYPKVGQRNSACRVGVVTIDTCKTNWLDIPGNPRNHYIARMDWVRDSQQIILQQLNRLQNTNRVMLTNAASGQVKTILTERDDAWVNVNDELRWLEDGKQFTWISERDGWRHVYLAPRNGGEATLVTPGDFDVIRLLHADDNQKWIYFTASPDNPTQCYLYRVKLDGTAREQLTPAGQDGTHRYLISTDARWAVHTVSTFDTPPLTELVSLPDHKQIRILAENKKLHDKVRQLKRQPTEFLRVKTDSGVLMDGWCIKPYDFDPLNKYPLLIHVYGEPAGQSVVDRWGGHNYLWHQMLAQQGYIITSFDNRGTPAPRGRSWRKSVYRQVGILAPQDQASAVSTLIKQRPYIDASRVGVWGWSGGGSMTLNAIFKYPDLYKTAIAVAAVPNQRFYDTIYQERYMGLPRENVTGFLQGSPINSAHQLKGNLLLIHGSGDDNCHYQGTEALIDELIRHNKPFSMMVYPNRSHAIREGKNTTLHLRTLMTQYLHEHLPTTGSLPHNRQ